MSQYLQLLKTRRFAPLFVAQFLGGLNDNLFKTAVIVMLTYGVLVQSESQASSLTSAAAGLFVLPYIFFSATGGILGDAQEKSQWMRRLKIIEIFVVIAGIAAIASKNIPFMLVIVFILGLQSALFSPFKYGILPQHLKRDELIAGNALIELGTFMAILGGSILAALFVNSPRGIMTVAVLLISFAVIGAVASYRIPLAPPSGKGRMPSFNFLKDTGAMFGDLFKGPRSVARAAISCSWYWFIGSIVVTQLPVYVRNEVGGSESVVSLLLMVLSVGTAAGVMMSNAMLRGQVTAKYAPYALFAMALFLCDLGFASPAELPETVANAGQFIAEFSGQRVTFDLLMFSFFGGLYVIPLQVYVQRFAHPSRRSRTIAALNIWLALFVFASAIFVMILAAFVDHVSTILLITGLCSMLGGLIVQWKLPRPEKEALANAAMEELTPA